MKKWNFGVFNERSTHNCLCTYCERVCASVCASASVRESGSACASA